MVFPGTGMYQHVGVGCQSSSSSGHNQGDIVHWILLVLIGDLLLCSFNIYLVGTEYYDGKTKRYIDYDITDILQMMGRAGRPQFDQHGKAVILVHEPKKSFYKKVMHFSSLLMNNP